MLQLWTQERQEGRRTSLVCWPRSGQCTPVSHWPSWPQGHTAGSQSSVDHPLVNHWSTVGHAGLPGPSPQSSFPAAQPPGCTGVQVIPPQVYDLHLLLLNLIRSLSTQFLACPGLAEWQHNLLGRQPSLLASCHWQFSIDAHGRQQQAAAWHRSALRRAPSGDGLRARPPFGTSAAPHSAGLSPRLDVVFKVLQFPFLNDKFSAVLVSR